MRRHALTTWLVALIALVVACGPAPRGSDFTSPPASPASTTASPDTTNRLTIYAAASLKVVLADLVSVYEADHPGTTITTSTDSSAALATQIEQGAPADVFLSADTAAPQRLVDGGLASGEVTIFAGNLLTVVVPEGNPAGIATPADLARPGVTIIAAGDAVPITRYADELVAKLGRQPGYPTAFAEAYAENVVSREDNVAAILSKLALGEGDAGIVYLTDASTSTDVLTIKVPADANVPATYGGIVVAGSRSPDAAAAFLAWVAGPDGQAVLISYGFQPAP